MGNSMIGISAVSLAAMIQRREVSSIEVVQAHLHAIEECNPSLNAVVDFDPKICLEQARNADQALANGGGTGLLHGVPVTIKDSMDVKGYRATAGTLGLKDRRPDVDIHVVKRLRDAGAVVLGKTNMPEVCMAFESDNLVYGRTNNPHDVTKTAGGSSGGEAAIIAAGGSPLGLGSDAGGSIRVPCHFCGIAGIKPTTGRIARSGHNPPPGGLIDSLWQIGPMARSVDDLELCLRLISGPDGVDPYVYDTPLKRGSEVDLQNLRVGFYTQNRSTRCNQEITDSVLAAARRLEKEGLMVEEVTPPLMENSHEVWLKLFGATGGSSIEGYVSMLGSDGISPVLKKCLNTLQRYETSNAELVGLFYQIDQYRSAMLQFMQNYDVLITPPCAITAPPHGTTWDADVFPAFSYTIDYNLTGYPAMVIPTGKSSEGLPVGVQVIAKPWREDVCFALGKLLMLRHES